MLSVTELQFRRLLAIVVAVLLGALVITYYFSKESTQIKTSATAIEIARVPVLGDTEKTSSGENHASDFKVGSVSESSPLVGAEAHIGNPNLSPDSTNAFLIKSHLGDPNSDPDIGSASLLEARVGDPSLDPNSISSGLEPVHIGNPAYSIE